MDEMQPFSSVESHQKEFQQKLEQINDPIQAMKELGLSIKNYQAKSAPGIFAAEELMEIDALLKKVDTLTSNQISQQRNELSLKIKELDEFIDEIKNQDPDSIDETRIDTLSEKSDKLSIDLTNDFFNQLKKSIEKSPIPETPSIPAPEPAKGWWGRLTGGIKATYEATTNAVSHWFEPAKPNTTELLKRFQQAVETRKELTNKTLTTNLSFKTNLEDLRKYAAEYRANEIQKTETSRKELLETLNQIEKTTNTLKGKLDNYNKSYFKLFHRALNTTSYRAHKSQGEILKAIGAEQELRNKLSEAEAASITNPLNEQQKKLTELAEETRGLRGSIIELQRNIANPKHNISQPSTKKEIEIETDNKEEEETSNNDFSPT